MLKKLLFFSVIGLLFFSSGIFAQTIFSDEFDDGLGKWDGWIDNASAVVTISLDANGVLSGTNSMKVDITTGSPDTYRIQRNSALPLVAGRKYMISFMAVASREGASINVLFEQAGDPYAKQLNEIAQLTTSPQTFTYTLASATEEPTNMIKLHFGGTGNDGAVIWVDAIVVKEEKGTAVIPEGNLTVNPEFDDAMNGWDGWIDAGSATVDITIDDSGVLSGPNSMKVDITTGSADTYRIQRNTPVPLLENYKYTISFWAVTNKEGASVNVLMEQSGDPYGKQLNEIVTLSLEPTVYTFKLPLATTEPTNYLKLHFGGPGNDGAIIWVDAVFVTAEEVNLSGGVYTVVEESGLDDSDGLLGSAWGDYDKDGYLDLFITGAGNPSALFKNDNGTGKFIKVSKEIATDEGILYDSTGGSYGCAFVDFDGDGNLDILASNAAAAIFQNNGSSFTDISGPAGLYTNIGFNPWGITAADYDQDGYVDFAYAGGTVTSNGAGPAIIMRNNGDMTFSDVTDEILGFELNVEQWNPAWVDVDNDGDMDLWMPTIRTPQEPCALLVNDGGELIYAAPDEIGIMAKSAITSGWGDFDNDGDMDLYLIPYSGDNDGNAKLYRNNGDLTFTDIAQPMSLDSGYTNSRGVCWGDFNNDGWKDLLIGRMTGSCQLWMNNEGTSFTEVSTEMNIKVDGRDPRTATFVDYDNDGLLDIYYKGNVSLPWLLHNNGKNANYDFTTNHWVVIRTVGTTQNTAAIGAKVCVVTSDLKQTRYIEAGASGMANGFLVAHFGLGAATTIDSVIVRWPNGTYEAVTNMPVDKYLSFIEGQGISDVDDAVQPNDYALDQNYPNPFNPETTISFNIPVKSDVRIELINVLGQVVKVLADGNYSSGNHKVTLNAGHLASGVYFYRMEAGSFISVKKLMLMK